MLKTLPAKTNHRAPLEQHARALAVILQEEFDEPFLFQDARTGALVHPAGEPARRPLDPAQVTEVASSGRARVTPLSGGCYQVAMPLYSSGQPILVGSATLSPLARQGTDAPREVRRLEKWTHSVCERLRGSDYILSRRGTEEESAHGKAAWDAILRLDHLLRHLRAHKHKDGSQQRILETVFDLLGVEGLVWVPSDPAAAVAVVGEAVLAATDIRQLSLFLSRNTQLRPGAPLLCNDFVTYSWGKRFPNVANLMAFAVADQKPLGWVVALNKKAAKNRDAKEGDYAPFRSSDAALLTPFVAVLGLHARTAARYQDIKDLLVGLTRSLTAALDAKDAYTFGHSERVARVAVELGRELGLDEDELGNVYLAGLLHDIGKIGVRDEVLTKAGPLTPEERKQIERHVTIGHAILADLSQIRDLLPGVLYHHESYDGKGYPEGLAGEAIPFLARLLAVADSYDAMSTTRPYRTALSPQRVEEILTEGAGKQWDRRVIDAFRRCRQNILAIRQRGLGGSLRQALDGALGAGDSLSVGVSQPPLASPAAEQG